MCVKSRADVAPNPSPDGTNLQGLVPGGQFSFGQRPFAFGTLYDENYSLDGFLDEFRVWDYVKTADEIAATYQQTVDPQSPGLNVYFRLDSFEFEAAESGNGASLHYLVEHRT